MDSRLSESSVLRALADAAAQRVARQAVRDLQRMPHILSGDDSELMTTWDELCDQVQYEESVFSDTYDLTVRRVVSRHVKKLPQHERAAIWLQTGSGIEWACDQEDDRDPWPACEDDITDYVTREYVYAMAGEWSNSRIRAFIDRSSRRD